MKKLINLGWYKGKAIYYDNSTAQLCVSDIEKDVNLKSFYVVIPLLTTLANVMVNVVGATAFLDTIIYKLVLFGIGSLIAFLGSYFFVDLVRKRMATKQLEIEEDELDLLLKECNHHRIVVESMLIVFYVFFILFGLLYIMISSDLRLLMVTSAAFLCLSILTIEYSPIKRRRALAKIKMMYKQ